MLPHPAATPSSTPEPDHLASLIRSHRTQRRSHWRRLDPGRQAPLALAHLRTGDTLTRLACGFEIGLATAPGDMSAKPSTRLPPFFILL